MKSVQLTNQDIRIILSYIFFHLYSITQTNLTKLEELIKQVASKVSVQIPLTSALHHLLATTAYACKQNIWLVWK